MIKMNKETKNFITGHVVGIITGIITLYIFYDYIEKQATTKADSPANIDSPTQFGNMNTFNWEPLPEYTIRQMIVY